MRTTGAVLFESPGQWEIVEIDVEAPRQDELLIEMVAAGLCHSDDHYAKGDSQAPLPLAGGHEGAGIVMDVGPNTPGWSVGDHVVMSFLPACGRCRWCSSGQQNLCDMGRYLRDGCREDGSFRMSLVDSDTALVDTSAALADERGPLAQMCGISTFSRHTLIDVAAAIKVDHDLPLTSACLAGCGVGTGWGSAVNSGEISPGQTVIVMGVGGIGIHAVQGAHHAGAGNVIAVDPVQLKRELAGKVGATATFASMAEAIDHGRSLTNGQGADAAIVCTGVLDQQHVREAFAAIRKAGIVVVTALGNADTEIAVNARELTLFQKRIQGSLFGESNPTADIPRMLDLYANGTLLLDELVTQTYPLEQINEGYADLHNGVILRGIIDYR